MGRELPPATNSGKIRSPLISTRANLTSFPANTGQETALPPQEGQGAQGALMAQPLFFSQGTSRYGGLQGRAGTSKPDPIPTIGEDGAIRGWALETQIEPQSPASFSGERGRQSHPLPTPVEVQSGAARASGKNSTPPVPITQTHLPVEGCNSDHCIAGGE